VERLLVAVDGSFASKCAVAHAIGVAARNRGTEVRILNVQPPIMVGDVSPLISVQVVSSWRTMAGEEALRDGRLLLDANRIPYTAEVVLGEPAATIVRVANLHHCTSIVMGTRGRSAIASLVFGSVAARVIRLAAVPVTLVRQAPRNAHPAAARPPRDLFDSCNAHGRPVANRRDWLEAPLPGNR
jgi:nucleotide-binding universal stress UspA family protein